MRALFSLPARLHRLPLLLGLFLVIGSGGPPAWAQDSLGKLRVQLSWVHQAEFAGFYMAEELGYFADEGLEVTLVEADGKSNPLAELQSGRADVALGTVSNALLTSSADRPLVNVAQIFPEPALILMCRSSAGVMTPADIIGKRISTGEAGDGEIIRAMVNRISPGDTTTRYLSHQPGSMPLLDGSCECMGGMTYDEYWRAVAQGVAVHDLLLLRPGNYGIHDLEGGVYALRDRLQSPQFTRSLVAFTQALRRGWLEAKNSPTQALTTVMQRNPSLDATHQRAMLESLGQMIRPDIGLLKLDAFEAVVRSSEQNFPGRIRDPDGVSRLWTHAVWNKLGGEEGAGGGLTEATTHYVRSVVRNPWFNRLYTIGALVYALAATLIAIEYGYDLWGRLIIAYLSCMGGGIIRDYFIGGDRLPLKFIVDPTLPLCVLALVVGVTLLEAHRRDLKRPPFLRRLGNLPEYFGFGTISMGGAAIAINAGMPLIWVPLCAAVSIAGGGVLRDIVINREPVNFRGKIFEEVAILGGACMVGLLKLADHVEWSPVPTYLALLFPFVIVISVHALVIRRGILYPAWLGAPKKSSP